MSGMVVACGVSFLTGIACRHVCAARWSPLPLAPRRAARARAHGALTSARTRPQACGLRGCWALAQVVSEPTASPTLSMRCVCHACRLAHASTHTRRRARIHAHAYTHTHTRTHAHARAHTRQHAHTHKHTQAPLFAPKLRNDFGISDGPGKMILVVNNELKMGKGKIGAQVRAALCLSCSDRIYRLHTLTWTPLAVHPHPVVSVSLSPTPRCPPPSVRARSIRGIQEMSKIRSFGSAVGEIPQASHPDPTPA